MEENWRGKPGDKKPQPIMPNPMILPCLQTDNTTVHFFRNDHGPAENVLKANFAEFGDFGKGKNLSWTTLKICDVRSPVAQLAPDKMT